MHHQCCQRYLE